MLPSSFSAEWHTKERKREHGVRSRLEEVADDRAIYHDTETYEISEFPAETVLLAVGMTARHDVAESLRRSAPETEVFVVGDAWEVGGIATAVRSAFKAAAYI